MRVAHALQARDGDEFAKPGTLVEVRFVKGQSLSLTAARLLALMILTAGGDAWEPVAHRMRKAGPVWGGRATPMRRATCCAVALWWPCRPAWAMA